MGDKRNDTIDAFRGVAILSVMAFHFLVRWAPPFFPENMYGYSGIYPAALAVGALGVHLFFVISGLVITMTVLRAHDALDFAALRFARLYPAYLFALILTSSVCAIAGPGQFKIGLRDLFANFTMVAADLHRKPADGAYWSLAIEIKFYFFVALSFCIADARFWLPIVGFAIIGTAAPLVGLGAFADHWMIAKYIPFFLLGIGMWFVEFEARPQEGYFLLGLGAVLYVIHYSEYRQVGVPDWLMHLYLPGLIFLMFMMLRFKPGWSLTPLPWIGRISYSLYLIHQYIGVIAIQWLTRRGLPDILATAIVSVGCFLLAALMFDAVEGPGKHFITKKFVGLLPLGNRS